ncbi:MAG TPA: hypothetical protein VFY38_04815, partial [Pseudonocardia sp.]|nr:hypothetical protein [Pseudonocardia sp.]
ETRAVDERRRPLADYRDDELTRMWQDIFGDRHGFGAARRRFVTKRDPAPAAPPRAPRPRSMVAAGGMS